MIFIFRRGRFTTLSMIPMSRLLLNHQSKLKVAQLCIFSLTRYSQVSLESFSPFFANLFAFCFALAVIYVQELFEFSLDSLLGTNCQRWMDDFREVVIGGEKVMIQGHGSIDTILDMVANSIGALAICIVGFIFLKKAKMVSIPGWLRLQRQGKH